MAKKTYYRRKKKVQVKRKKYAKGSQTTAVIGRPGSFISNKAITCLKYNERFTINLTGGTPADYQFRLNSLFDPNLTGTGHQPYGFDQLTVLYNRYRVFKTKYVIKMISGTTGNFETTIVCNNSATSITTPDLAPESNNSKYKQWNYYNPITISGVINLPRLNGETSAQYKANENTQSQIGANPGEVLNMHIVNTADTGSSVIADVMLCFYAEFFDPIQLPQS